jgi:hypothetical protein
MKLNAINYLHENRLETTIKNHNNTGEVFIDEDDEVLVKQVQQPQHKPLMVTSDHRSVAPANGANASMMLHAADFIAAGELPEDAEDSFYIVDIGACVKLYQHLDQAMPRVTPHYAVKCFPNPMILAALANEGAGFDCASKNELEMVMKLGVDPR